MTEKEILAELQKLDEEWDRLDSTGQTHQQNKIADEMQGLRTELEKLKKQAS